VLDTFTAPNGPLSAAWQDLGAGYRISNNEMRVNSGEQYVLWNTAWGLAQEAFITFNAIDASATEFDLVLQAQGNAWSDGALMLYYDPAGHTAQIWTYSPGQSWQQHGSTYALILQPGDVFGGRVYASGLVEMYRNGGIVASANVSSWTDFNKPGRAGLWMINAPNASMDNFGAGAVTNCNRTTNDYDAAPPPETAVPRFPMGVQAEAVATSDGTHVSWTTYRTQTVSQFRLLRSESSDRAAAVEVNTSTLSGEPQVRGSYSFVDTGTRSLPIQSERSYWLQVVYADGHVEELGPIPVEPGLGNPFMTLYMPVISR